MTAIGGDCIPESVYKVPGDDTRFYAVFTTSMTGLMGSAICSFTLGDIQVSVPDTPPVRAPCRGRVPRPRQACYGWPIAVEPNIDVGGDGGQPGGPR